MGFYDNVIELFTGEDEEETTYLPYVEKRNIGEIKKSPEFVVDKLVEDPEFLRVVEELFSTPSFMVKLTLEGKAGLIIEIPVENFFRGRNSKDESVIKISRVGISFVTMRSETQEIKDDGTTIETKKKIEEIQYDFKGLPNNYPKEVDGDTFSLFVPYAKMAYFVEVLIDNKIININTMRVTTSEPLECKSYNFNSNKEKNE